MHANFARIEVLACIDNLPSLARFDVLEGICVPALVAVGERDVPGFREMSAVLARRIPGAAYRVVAGAGHMVNMEQPAAINDLLISFVQEASWTR